MAHGDDDHGMGGGAPKIPSTTSGAKATAKATIKSAKA